MGDLDIHMPQEVRDHPAAKLPGKFMDNYKILQGLQQQEEHQNMAQQLQAANMNQANDRTQQLSRQRSYGAESAVNRSAVAKVQPSTFDQKPPNGVRQRSREI